MEDLYALPPEEFTAARDAAAKTDKALKQLRRPTVSAWVVNTLVRQDSDLLDQVLELGHDLRQAQTARDATDLRSLSEQRRQVVEAAVDRAVALTGRSVSAAVRAEVAGTFEAALSDPASGEAVRTGRLVRPLSYAGFGGVDLQDAVAGAPTAGPEARPARARSRAPKTVAATTKPAGPGPQLERAALAAAGALDDAVRRAETAERAAAEADGQARDADDELQQAQEAVAAAERDLVAARDAVPEVARRRTARRRAAGAAATAAAAARADVVTAQQAADAARRELDRARRRS